MLTLLSVLENWPSWLLSFVCTAEGKRSLQALVVVVRGRMMVDDFKTAVANPEVPRALVAVVMAFEECVSSRQEVILETDSDCLWSMCMRKVMRFLSINRTRRIGTSSGDNKRSEMK